MKPHHHNPTTVVKVEHDALFDTTKVTVRPPHEVTLAFSNQALNQSNQSVVQHIASTMAKELSQAIAAQITEDLLSGNFPAFINDFASSGLTNQQKKMMDLVKHDFSTWNQAVYDEVMDWVDSPTDPLEPIGKASPGGTTVHAPVNTITGPLHAAIPGFGTMREPCPLECPSFQMAWLQDTILHLNDKHQWTREDIANWLETLDHDLSFKTPEEVNNNDDSV